MEKILVLDFGGQYNQLIARRVREQHVYAEIRSCRSITLQDIKDEHYSGVILTGGPNSVYDENSLHFDPELINIGIPVLGICYGAQLIAWMANGKVGSAENSSEYGRTVLHVKDDVLFEEVPETSICWMSHTDFIKEVPDGFKVTAITDKCPCAAMSNPDKNIYAVQFHPEVTHSEFGRQILANFIFKVCKCSGDWQIDDFIEKSIEQYRNQLKGKKVLLALSGGVDSSVVAMLLHKAIGHDLVCVFVDHGLLRKDEGDSVERIFKDQFDLNLIRVNCKDRFLTKLKGITNPEKKRKIIGEEFIRVFEEESRKLGEINYLAQGTIYPDVIESGKGDSAVIKSHHNVGGLPENVGFEGIVEPLRNLFKDEVRETGIKLGIPAELVYRQPFPGPGLAVRVMGEITDEKLNLLKEADAIFREELERSLPRGTANQYFAVLTNTNSVGVIGDFRNYGYVVALRSVTTDDFMTADWSKLPYDLLDTVSNRIVNEVRGISRVVYDITSKPPGTIEWE